MPETAGRFARMRKYALARRVDPCPRRHRWIQSGTRGKQYEEGPSIYKPLGPRRCVRCSATAPQVPQLLQTAVAQPHGAAYGAFRASKLLEGWGVLGPMMTCAYRDARGNPCGLNPLKHYHYSERPGAPDEFVPVGSARDLEIRGNRG